MLPLPHLNNPSIAPREIVPLGLVRASLASDRSTLSPGNGRLWVGQLGVTPTNTPRRRKRSTDNWTPYSGEFTTTLAHLLEYLASTAIAVLQERNKSLLLLLLFGISQPSFSPVPTYSTSAGRLEEEKDEDSHSKDMETTPGPAPGLLNHPV